MCTKKTAFLVALLAILIATANNSFAGSFLITDASNPQLNVVFIYGQPITFTDSQFSYLLTVNQQQTPSGFLSEVLTGTVTAQQNATGPFTITLQDSFTNPTAGLYQLMLNINGNTTFPESTISYAGLVIGGTSLLGQTAAGFATPAGTYSNSAPPATFFLPSGPLTLEETMQVASGAVVGQVFNMPLDMTLTPPSNPVPEPSSVLLLGTGLIGGIGVMRRRFPT